MEVINTFDIGQYLFGSISMDHIPIFGRDKKHTTDSDILIQLVEGSGATGTSATNHASGRATKEAIKLLANYERKKKA